MSDIVDISGKPIEAPEEIDVEQTLRDAFSFFFGNLIEEDEADVENEPENASTSEVQEEQEDN